MLLNRLDLAEEELTEMCLTLAAAEILQAHFYSHCNLMHNFLISKLRSGLITPKGF